MTERGFERAAELLPDAEPVLIGGFTFCNPAFTDGRGAMSNDEYIDTCPEEWQPTLRTMALIMDILYPDNWKITQIKEKFGEPRVYLTALERPSDDSKWREAMSGIESMTEGMLSWVDECIKRNKR